MTTMTTNRKYALKRGTPDFRNFKYKIVRGLVLPPKYDMRNLCPPVYDQGDIGSCTANAICAALRILYKTSHKPDLASSRLGLYYLERLMEGTTTEDAGAVISTGFKVCKKQGVFPESMWGYVPENLYKTPSQACMDVGEKHQILKYSAVPRSLYAFKFTLTQNKPIVIGISVYDSFEGESVSKTGIVPMPKRKESLLGGHAILVVGYDEEKQHFICRNSWGTSWGDKGYFYLPYKFITNRGLSDDFWVADLTE